MDLYIIVLRLAHIVFGVFWVGAVWFNALFLLPSVEATGAEGRKVMQHIAATNFPALMTWSSILVVVSGILLYWKDSAGFQVAWIGTAAGITLTISGLAGLAVFGDGLFTSRRAAQRLASIGQEVAASGGPPTSPQAAEIQQLAEKLERGTYRSAYLLAIAVIGMSIARYL